MKTESNQVTRINRTNPVNPKILVLFLACFAFALDLVDAQDTGLRIDKNSVFGTLQGAQILLFENEDDYARLRISNILHDAGTNNRFWDIAGRIGPDNSGLEDRLNFFLNGVGDILSLRGTGRVGIGTISPAAKLHVIGDIRASSLSGNGDRKVVADANGTLKTESASTKYLSLSGGAFHPDNDKNSDQWIASFDGAYFISAPGHLSGMIAPVFLPHNAVVTNITVYYTDTDAEHDVNFGLGRVTNSNGNFGNIVSLSSSGSGGYSSTSTSTTLIVNNLLNSYYFIMLPKVLGTMDSDFKIHSVVIKYTE